MPRRGHNRRLVTTVSFLLSTTRPKEANRGESLPPAPSLSDQKTRRADLTPAVDYVSAGGAALAWSAQTPSAVSSATTYSTVNLDVWIVRAAVGQGR